MSARFIDSYVHKDKVGVLLELNTVDDFVTRTEEFRALAKDLAIQIAAMDPTSIDGAELNNVVSMVDRIRLSEHTENNLLSQDFVRDPSQTVADRIRDTERRLGAKIEIIRFVRFEAGAT